MGNARRPLLAICGVVVLVACTARQPAPPASVPVRPGEDRESTERAPGAAPRPVPREVPERDLRVIYFLHERGYALDRCDALGPIAAGTDYLPGTPEAQRQRSQALLEMATEARKRGGNVVLLPHFSEEFEESRLTGELYRCAGDVRRLIFRRATAEERLTVVEP